MVAPQYLNNICVVRVFHKETRLPLKKLTKLVYRKTSVTNDLKHNDGINWIIARDNDKTNSIRHGDVSPWPIISNPALSRARIARWWGIPGSLPLRRPSPQHSAFACVG